MDANDAASYVQDLAGEDANIIFGAKFDETMTDEATITVIATGLESPMKSVAAPGGVSSRMVYPNQTVNRQPAASGIVNRAASTNSYVGTGVTNNASVQRNSIPVTPRPATRQTTSTYTGIQRPKQPESSVKPVEINIPDFLKNSKR